MVLDRGAWVALVMLSGVAAGCDSAPLATPHPVDTGIAPQSLVIPDDVVAPLLSCGDGVGAVALQLPCELGMAPASEVDCGLVGAPANQKIRFLLPLSLPDALEGGKPALGTPTRFEARLLPFGNDLMSTLGDGKYTPQSIVGSVVFTELSLPNATADGWFPHLDLIWAAADGSTISCSLDRGRFTAIPGDFL